MYESLVYCYNGTHKGKKEHKTMGHKGKKKNSYSERGFTIDNTSKRENILWCKRNKRKLRNHGVGKGHLGPKVQIKAFLIESYPTSTKIHPEKKCTASPRNCFLGQWCKDC